MSREDHPEFMQYFEEVVRGIKSSQEWEAVVEHKVGLALETLSHGQQSAVTALQHLYTEVQISGEISNDRVAQYWNDLETLHERVQQHQKSQEERIAEASRQEGERRTAVEGEIAGEVTQIRTDMQEFVNKQLSGWIQQGVASGLSNLPLPPPALTLEQIREVVQAEQPNPVVERLRREEQERANQKEKETFKRWMQEQIKEAEKNMEKKIAERTKQLQPAEALSPERRTSRGAEDRFSRWASQIPPNLPELPPSPRDQTPPPPPPPKSK
jgi:exonuclease VII large subunit